MPVSLVDIKTIFSGFSPHPDPPPGRGNIIMQVRTSVLRPVLPDQVPVQCFVFPV